MVMSWLKAYAAARRATLQVLVSAVIFIERELPAALPFDDNGQIRIPELCSFFLEITPVWFD
jgi:hypothetical protein